MSFEFLHLEIDIEQEDKRMRRMIFQFVMAGAVIVFLIQPGMANGSDVASVKANGSSVFQSNCAVCHGEDGSGSAVGKSLHAPDLRSTKVQMQSNAALARFISEGKGAMPAFKDRLDHQQILDEVHYLRSLAKSRKANR